MPVPRLLKLATGSLLTLQLVLPGSALAHGPTECTSGPARLASADAPALVDAHNDMTNFGTAHGNATDVIGAWITGPSAWEDRTKPQKFVGHIRVEALDRPPAFVRYYLLYDGADGERWVRAVYDVATQTYSYHYGTLNGTTYTQNGDTTGSVDTATGILSIDLPAPTLPARPADGKAKDVPVTAARSFLRHEPIPGGVVGNLRLIDEALGGDCTTTLYEKDPALP